MPRGGSRKRASAGAPSSVSHGPHDRGYVAPGGGTPSDIARLSRALALPADAVLAVMNCGGQGVAGSGGRPSRRSAGGSEDAAGVVAATAAADPAMLNVWGDFMSEEMGGDAPAAAGGAPSPAKATAAASPTPATPVVVAPAAADGPRRYALPVRPRMRLEGDDDDDDDDDDAAPAPGVLAQTGTLDATEPGRKSGGGGGGPRPAKGAAFGRNAPPVPRNDLAPHELQCPTLLCPVSIFARTKVAFVAASASSCHSVAIAADGRAYGWGRNESGQLGLGHASPCVALPVLLAAAGDEAVRFAGAAVGKYHTVLVGRGGLCYASGANLCGQLGINNAGAREVDRFRKCVVAGQLRGGGEGEEDGEGCVRIVQASCGENISALLSSAGHLYTAGSSEFGQLGNGETGEHIVSAGKLGYANCAKFVRRAVFCQSESDAVGGVATKMMTGKGVDSAGNVKSVTLEDSGQICLAHVSCGKTHIVAIEAPSTVGGAPATPRVFTWGSGDYGRLGHGIQADEYTPRLVGGLRGPLFAHNPPVSVVAGSNCTLIRTKNGHVYYVGKHKSAGEATMRPTLVDALANNGHVVTAVGAGNQTVFCATGNGVTVSWGNGSYGELGYGKDENKSSSKPKFVNGLDACLVTDVACGFGHTLFIVRDDDAEDAKALKKVIKVEETDLSEFVAQMKGKKGATDAGGDEPAKKKQKGKGKK